MNMFLFVLLGCGFSLGAVALLVAAMVVYTRRSKKREGQVTVTGKVISVSLGATVPGNAGVYYPTVEFTTVDGETYTFESDFGTRPASHKVGQVVKVSYDPLAPEEAEIDSSLSRFLMPGILGFMGILGLLLGMCFLLFTLIMFFAAQSP